jgi:hypothetical protein
MPITSSSIRKKKAKSKKKTAGSQSTNISSKDQAISGNAAQKDESTRLDHLWVAIKSSRFGNCSTYSEEECIGIAEAILESEDDIVAASSEFLDISTQEAQSLLKVVFARNTDDQDSCSSNDTTTFLGADSNIDVHEFNDEEESIASADSADDYIVEGECELCEREVKLTQHHLIPKCTWKHIKARFMKAAKPYEKSHFEEVKDILGLGSELPEGISYRTFTSGLTIRHYLAHHTAYLCRACHSCIHSNHDNMDLAERYNSVEKLLEDEKIYKFCKWQSKQKKQGKHTLKR